jgi:hypothetical protein
VRPKVALPLWSSQKCNIGLGCTRTSAKEFPSIYVMMYAATDAAGTVRALLLAVKGSALEFRWRAFGIC